jgi:tRNA A22 N-methylase
MAGGGLEIINILADLENLIEGKTLFLQQAKDENLLRDTLGADHVEVDND